MWMRYLMILMLLVGIAYAADETEAAPGKVELPADAVKVDNLTWRHTDAEGKAWTYRQTPFGLVRFEAQEDDEAEAQAGPSDTLIKAFDAGDEVRFERMSPFGLQRWTRKKTELTDAEREAWEQAQKAEAMAESDSEDSSAQE